MFRSLSSKEQIIHDLETYPVVLYMKGDAKEPRCGFSARAVACLDALGVPFETRDVLLDDQLRSAIKEHGDWPTLPQLYIGGELIGGCDIICALFDSGELAERVKAVL